jgi:hypothetical protein
MRGHTPAWELGKGLINPWYEKHLVMRCYAGPQTSAVSFSKPNAEFNCVMLCSTIPQLVLLKRP